MLVTQDEEFKSPFLEGSTLLPRMEQVTYPSLSGYGMVPGSYCDPVLYNTKKTSPFRWHMTSNSSDIMGHWYMEHDEIWRIKDWQPKNPDDPFEMFPRPPSAKLQWEETVDAQGNRTFRYKYRYDFNGPTGTAIPHQKYPMAHLYVDSNNHLGKLEPYGFKQGHLLRCDDEEEEVLRRVMLEEDREWEMVKQTELIQEAWFWPGKMQPKDFEGAVDRAKARFREQIRQGKETDPSEDPEYDLVQAGEFVEPRDGPRAEWRHLWTSNKKPGEGSQYKVRFNDGVLWEHNEDIVEHPDSHFEQTPKEAPWKKYEAEDRAWSHDQAHHSNVGTSDKGKGDEKH
jgi:hypothetical protein